jgi:heparanase
MMIRKTLLAATALIALGGASKPAAPALQLGKLDRVATVDARYQGYNIEMVEVTGGRFWAPYGGPGQEMFRQRPPLDLTDKRLLALAKNLGPALMRVSGTWSNNTYLEAEGEHLSAIPAGYRQVLTRQQWRSVVAFSKAADAPIVTSFAVSGGTRGADGVWTTDQAQRVADLTSQEGGTLYAAEFFNEPNLPSAAEGMTEGYNADNYAREFRIFRDWAKKAVPQMKIIGPGGANEGSMFKERQANEPEHPLLKGHIATEDMMARNPGTLDAVSYHFYGSVSQRCAALNKGTAVKADALTPAWLDRTLLDFEFYSALRDKYEPGKPLWNTETAQAACGGSPWASTYLDTFRYLNQNAVLAQKGVQVVLHNTLATSDYALIERDTMTPRPNYWAAVLWHRTMGSTVLASPRSPSPALRLYAHCSPQKAGGVTVMALNTGEAAQRFQLGGAGMGWTMTGQPLDTREVKVNGRVPALSADGQLTGLEGVRVRGGVSVPGQSVAFFTVPGAKNPACR